MSSMYKSDEGARRVRERYLELLKSWPVANQQLCVPTRQGETFIVVCGDEKTPSLLLFHGSAANSAMWMRDIAAWAPHFRVYAVDMIGEPGLSAPSRPSLKSEAYALRLDDVLQALAISRASIVSVSLGGWLALDYAIRRAERVASLVVLSPSGVGRQRISILLKLIALRMCGRWETRKAREMVLGQALADTSPSVGHFIGLMSLIHQNFRPRLTKPPIFTDNALKRLNMPLMAILGGKDVLLDSVETKHRLERNVSGAEIRFVPEAGHFIPGQTTPILNFLRRSVAA